MEYGINKTHFACIRKTTAMFLEQFTDLTCSKFDTSGNVLKVIKVPVILSGKEKFAIWTSLRKHEKRMPIIGVSQDGLSFDQNRMRATLDTSMYMINPIQQIPFTSTLSNTASASISGAKGMNFPPIPYKVNYTVMIASLYQIEIEQILEQILPFFIPNNWIIINIPEINQQFKCSVVLQSCSQQENVNMSADNYRNILYTLKFEVMTYLIAPNWQILPIKEIDLTFNPRIAELTDDKSDIENRYIITNLSTSAQMHDKAIITAENTLWENEVD